MNRLNLFRLPYWYTTILAVLLLTSAQALAVHEYKERYKVKKIIKGADFHGTASVNFNPNGDMYIVDFISGEIMEVDPNTGKVLSRFSEFVETAEIDFSSDGTLYWANPFSGEVYKRSLEGDIQLIGKVNTVIDGVAVNDQGRVFTASFSRSQNGLWEIDPNGIEPPRLVVELGGFDAFDFGPDGYLYAPDYLYGTGNIYKIDIDSGDYSVVANGYCQPIATKFNSAGELHVMDSACPKIDKVNIETGEKALVATLEAGCDNFDFNLDDEIYFANNANAYIGKILPDGTTEYITRPGLSAPGSISVRSDGSLFVADAFAMRRYNTHDKNLEQTYYANAGMIPPFSMSDDGDSLILTNNLFGYVQIWDPDLNTAKATFVDFNIPLNAIRFQDELVVAELGSGSVVKHSDRSPLISGLIVPTGLAGNGQDLYVADYATGIVWQAVKDGSQLDSPIIITDQLTHPEGMTMDLEGNLLVMDVGTRKLVKVNPETGDTSVIAKRLKVGLDPLTGTPPTWAALSDVTVSDSGVIYATGDKRNVIYKITPRRR